MVCPKGCRLFCQAKLDAILKHPVYPLDMPVGFAIANGDVVVDNAQPRAELCEAAYKLGSVVYLDIVWFAPIGNQVII